MFITLGFTHFLFGSLPLFQAGGATRTKNNKINLFQKFKLLSNSSPLLYFTTQNKMMYSFYFPKPDVNVCVCVRERETCSFLPLPWTGHPSQVLADQDVSENQTPTACWVQFQSCLPCARNAYTEICHFQVHRQPSIPAATTKEVHIIS